MSMTRHRSIAIGGISSECSTYSPLLQTEEDFETIEGPKLLDFVGFPFEKFGIEARTVFFQKSIPGGPIDLRFYSKSRDDFLDQIKEICPLDGILLIMHGAMYVPGIEDPEGDWIEKIRSIVGEQCIISVSFDLHGNVTDRIIGNIDAFAAYRTAPHTDVKETFYRASKLLVDAVNGFYRPEVVWLPIPVLVSGERTSTVSEPCKSIYAQMENFDSRDGILDANLMIGYVWADIVTATASAVVTCTDSKVGGDICVQIAKIFWEKRNDLTFDMRSGNIKGALDWLPSEFSIFADSGDNPTAGGVGDRADVLEALIKEGIEGVLVAGIVSPGIVAELNGKKEASIIVGCKIGGGGPVLKLNIKKICLKNECAIVSVNGIKIILTERRRPFHLLNDFTDLGIELKDYRLLVVKSGYLSPELKSLSAPSFMILTDGAVCQDIDRLKNKNRQRGIFPFQNRLSYTPTVGKNKNTISTTI